MYQKQNSSNSHETVSLLMKTRFLTGLERFNSYEQLLETETSFKLHFHGENSDSVLSVNNDTNINNNDTGKSMNLEIFLNVEICLQLN